MGGLFFGYLILCFIFFLIGVAILRWAFRINKIVTELELIRKALGIAHNIVLEGEPKTHRDKVPKTPEEALVSKKSWF